jgi:peptide/nickel transport system substrate-binding protein
VCEDRGVSAAVSERKTPMKLPQLLFKTRWLVLAAALGVAALVSVAGATGSRHAKPAIDLNATIVEDVPSSSPTGDPHKLGVALASLEGWERLFRIDWQGNVQPMLATAYSFSKDAKSLTLKLRKGVKFHDGTTFDATAVKASLDRARTLSGSAYATIFADIDSVNIIDPYTVRIDLKFGGAELIRNLAGLGGSIINPKCIAPNAPPIDNIPPECTTSPMIVDHNVVPLEWYFVRSPDKSWDPQAYRYKRLNIITVANPQTILNSLQTGDATTAQLTAESIEAAKDLIRRGTLQGKPYRTPAISAIFLNPRRPPFNNVLLRRAVQAAVDSRTIALNFFSGDCVPTQQPAAHTSLFYDRKWNPNPYNPDLAKQLLAQAGVPNGFSFDLYTQPIQLNVGPAQIVQNQLAKVGITMNIRVVPTTSVPEIRTGTANSKWGAWGQANDPSTAVDFILNLLQNNLASAVGSDVENQIRNLSYHAIDPTLSPQARGKVYQQIWKIAYNNALMVNICALGQIYPGPKNLRGNDTIDYRAQGGGGSVRYLFVTK